MKIEGGIIKKVLPKKYIEKLNHEKEIDYAVLQIMKNKLMNWLINLLQQSVDYRKIWSSTFYVFCAYRLAAGHG